MLENARSDTRALRPRPDCSERSPLHDVRKPAADAEAATAKLCNPGRDSCTASIRYRASHATRAPSGGARRDRTDDLLLAKQALSQLSYGPKLLVRTGHAHWITTFAVSQGTRSREVVGLGRLELPTSRLSSARSNQLSYKPLMSRTGRRPRVPHHSARAQRSRHGLVQEERETETAASRQRM